MNRDVPAAVSAFRRTEQAYCAQLGSPEPLECGLVYCAPAFDPLADAGQVRDVLVRGQSWQQAHEQVELHFRARSARCRRWGLSVEESESAAAAFLEPRGWARRERVILAQRAWESLAGMVTRPAPRSAALRILPARAMRAALRATFLLGEDVAEAASHRERMADAAEERLNDSNNDAFVAVFEGQPAGRVGMLEVGDICRVYDIYVLPPMRGRGIGRALLRHAVQLAYRLRPRELVASLTAGEPTVAAQLALFGGFGFEEAGRVSEWEWATAEGPAAGCR